MYTRRTQLGHYARAHTFTGTRMVRDPLETESIQDRSDPDPIRTGPGTATPPHTYICVHSQFTFQLLRASRKITRADGIEPRPINRGFLTSNLLMERKGLIFLKAIMPLLVCFLLQHRTGSLVVNWRIQCKFLRPCNKCEHTCVTLAEFFLI
jgi:hypothetical protein